MARFACLDQNGVIVNMLLAASADDLASECSQALPWEEGMDIGKKLIDGVWKDQSMILNVELGSNLVSVGSEVTATATVKNRDGDINENVSGEYYVPVIRQADNWQAKLLKVAFSQGQATITFSISEPGIYTIDLTKVYPSPISELADSPILIVEDD